MLSAPIIVFSFNRPDHLRKTLEALSRNEGALNSILYIYCDNARKGADPEQVEKVAQNRLVAKSAKGFKEVHIIERESNFGLADNIINAVTEIVNKYGRVITLEDDVVTSRGFIRYMNDALEMYKDDEKVMHISAYMYPHKCQLPETFFYEVPYPGGGWATWKRAWDHFDNNIDSLYAYWSSRWKEFNKYGGDYLQQQLQANKDGTLYTWFIKWHAVILKMGGLTLYPGRSLTNNIGFDSSGSNCGTMSNFDILDPADYVEVCRIIIKEDRRAARIIHQFYYGHWYSKRYRRQFLNKIQSFFHVSNEH